MNNIRYLCITMISIWVLRHLSNQGICWQFCFIICYIWGEGVKLWLKIRSRAFNILALLNVFRLFSQTSMSLFEVRNGACDDTEELILNYCRSSLSWCIGKCDWVFVMMSLITFNITVILYLSQILTDKIVVFLYVLYFDSVCLILLYSLFHFDVISTFYTIQYILYYLVSLFYTSGKQNLHTFSFVCLAVYKFQLGMNWIFFFFQAYSLNHSSSM